jgi:hypothetical protein
MFFRRNELNYLLHTKGLAILGAENELVFERKKGQTNSKKLPKIHLLRRISREFGSSNSGPDWCYPWGTEKPN